MNEPVSNGTNAAPGTQADRAELGRARYERPNLARSRLSQMINGNGGSQLDFPTPTPAKNT